MIAHFRAWLAAGATVLFAGCGAHQTHATNTIASVHTCFVLTGIDVAFNVRKGDVCDERHPPASTFNGVDGWLARRQIAQLVAPR